MLENTKNSKLTRQIFIAVIVNQKYAFKVKGDDVLGFHYVLRRASVEAAMLVNLICFDWSKDKRLHSSFTALSFISKGKGI